MVYFSVSTIGLYRIAETLVIHLKGKAQIKCCVSIQLTCRLHCNGNVLISNPRQIQRIAIYKVLRTIDGLRHHREAIHLDLNGLVAICRAVQLLHIDIRACHVLHVDGLLAFGLYAVGQREVVGLHFGDVADAELLLEGVV